MRTGTTMMAAGLAAPALLALSACVSTPPPRLEDVEAGIRTVRVICVVPQDEVMAEPEPGKHSPAFVNSGQPLVDAHASFAIGMFQEIRRAHAYRVAQQRIAPLKEQIRDLQPRRDHCERLRASLAAAHWRDVTDFSIAAETIPEHEITSLLQQGKEDALLVLTTSYVLRRPKYAMLQATTDSSLYLREGAQRVHWARYVYYSEMLDQERYAGAVLAWAADGARLYRAAYRQAMDETLSMLRTDLLERSLPESRITEEAVTLHNGLYGYVAHKTAQRRRVTVKLHGIYYSAQRQTPASEDSELESLASTMERMGALSRAGSAKPAPP